MDQSAGDSLLDEGSEVVVPRNIRIDIPDGSSASIQAGIAEAVRMTFEDIRDSKWDTILDDLIPELERLHATYFSSQTAPDGSPWKALSPFTVARKGFRRILDDTGSLRASLTGRRKGAIRRVRNRELVFGTSVPYAVFHQKGFRNARTNRGVSARPHVGIGEEGVKRISEKVADAIVKQL